MTAQCSIERVVIKRIFPFPLVISIKVAALSAVTHTQIWNLSLATGLALRLEPLLKNKGMRERFDPLSRLFLTVLINTVLE
jgi:hypothetical protein